MVDNEQKASKILHNDQIFIIRLPIRWRIFYCLVIFFCQLYGMPCRYIKICTEKSEKSENSHFSHISHIIFFAWQTWQSWQSSASGLPSLSTLPTLPMHFLHRQLFRMISGSSSFFISVAHLQQPTCFQSLMISWWYLNYLLFITGIISVQLHCNLY